jgi:hypothetical protein
VHRTPSFPSTKDLPELDADDARAALTELRRLVRRELAIVYTRPYHEHGEHPLWNVWFERLVWPIGEQRVELGRWAAARLAVQRSPEGGAQ